MAYELPIVIYALIVDGRIRGGDNKPEIYWTKAMARLAKKNRYPDDELVRVRISLEDTDDGKNLDAPNPGRPRRDHPSTRRRDVAGPDG